MKTITEYDRGYWIAVQNVASFDFQPDKQAVKALIRDAGFDRDTCLKLMDEYDFNAEIIRQVVDEMYPVK
jgi:hypothetical protein